MSEMFNFDRNPFSAPLAKPSAERPTRFMPRDSAWSWASVGEMRRAIETLPPAVKGVLHDDMRRRSDYGDAGGPPDETETPEALSRTEKGIFKNRFSRMVCRYLEENLLQAVQIGERLRRGEAPAAIRTEIEREMDRMFTEGRAPFVDADHLELRCKETESAMLGLWGHSAEHEKKTNEVSMTIREIERQPRLLPYERELLKKFRSLRKFLGDPVDETGHIGDLARQRKDMARELGVLRESRNAARMIERTMEKNVARLTIEDFADIWGGVASTLGHQEELRFRGYRNLGQEAEALEVKKQLLATRGTVFVAALEWLGKQSADPENRGASGSRLLARWFNDLYLELAGSADEPNPARTAVLEQAQVVMRRLVRTAEA